MMEKSAKPIAVLLLFPVAEIGGAERVMLNFLERADRSAFRYSALILSDREGDLEEALSRRQIPVRRLPRGRMRSPMAMLRASLRIRREIIGQRISIALTNSPQGYLYARAATIGLGVRHVLYYMTDPHTVLWRNGPLDILTARIPPQRLLVPSRKIEIKLRAWQIPQVETIYHGTPETDPSPADTAEVQSVLSRLAISKTDPVLLFVGRLQAWKGQHILVEALPVIRRQFPTVRAIFLGETLFDQEPEYPDRLRRRIRELGLTDHACLLGQRPVPAWLTRASALVHASIRPDPFPNVCIEAMAARIPIITNTLCGTGEIVTDGRSAFIVAPENAERLADAVVRLLSFPLNAHQIGEEGYRQYRRYCTAEKMVAAMESTLRRLTQENPRPEVPSLVTDR